MKKNRAHVRMFQPRFAEAVRDGSKRQTIRPRSMRPPRRGELLHLRMWQGAAYRSKQLRLRDNQTCRGCRPVVITAEGICFDPGTNHEVFRHGTHLDGFARSDGFASWLEMKAWFEGRYTLPFEGDLILW
jgi:hypothetical protein